MPFKSVFKLVSFLAVFASLTLHVVAMAIAPQFDEDVQVSGGEEAVAAALGSNFQDLVKASDELSPVEAETVEPAEPETIEENDAKTDVAAEPEAMSTPVPSVPVAETVPSGPVTVAVPIASAPTTDLAMLAPTEPMQTIEAQPDEPVIPVPTTRPFRQIDKDRLEKAKLEEKKAQAQRKKTVKTTRKKKSASGSSKSKARANARAGNASAQKNNKSANAGKKQSNRSTKAGNAAASNYPGKVRSKISRTRQRNAGGRGMARVRFSVSSSGAATGVSIARSSGNAKVDRAAVAHIKRASPFAKPPAGAQRQFVIPLEFRR